MSAVSADFFQAFLRYCALEAVRLGRIFGFARDLPHVRLTLGNQFRPGATQTTR
jgi:hypothetical protein